MINHHLYTQRRLTRLTEIEYSSTKNQPREADPEMVKLIKLETIFIN